MRTICLILITFITVLSSGCATSYNTATSDGSNAEVPRMYPLSPEQADQVLINAMNYQFPDAPIVRVELPYKGYFVTRRFLIDSHDFTARMIPSKGIDEAGKVYNGYIFEVLADGTRPSGLFRASSLFNKIKELANAQTKTLKLVQ